MKNAAARLRDKRLERLLTLEEKIAAALAEAQANGELRSAPSWGRPLHFGDGYDETPDAFKMPFKILKDAGYAPPEVDLMREIARLQQELEGLPDDETTQARRRRLSEMRQHLALRLEGLRRSASL
ncbi:MAG: DUF1992 domain-containing protein [Burkholderiales bacterium]|nr:DUF1992 domain-containing protein [Burkholderiales bacterium]MDE2394976.1 DUF1992 domain-containing protein [Burkholderiales bacterium]MDE2452124.1 DUF1992 domain-containing protein [Burkholderiales bacterium]